MVDNELLPKDTTGAPTTKDRVLGGLLGSDLVLLYRYADEGPPADTPAMTPPDIAGGWNASWFYEGWVTVTHFVPESDTWGVAYAIPPSSYATGGIVGNIVQIATTDVRFDVYSDLSPDDAAQKREADAIASQVASQALKPDLYITERPYLHHVNRWIAKGTTLCSVDEALPLLGLYFRAQDQYPIVAGFNYNRGLFYLVGARELLPESWRYLTALQQYASAAGNESIVGLAFSLFQRLERALQDRDRVHLALNQPQHRDTQRDALSQLDAALVDLMSCVDVAARIAHLVLGFPENSSYQASWQRHGNRTWISQVKRAHPALAAVVAPGSRGYDALMILRLLRNRVHGAILNGFALKEAGGDLQSVMEIPETEEPDVMAAMDALGGRAGWGTRNTIPGECHVDPGEFADRLFDEVVVLLNKIMENTPVERLVGVSLIADDSAPPSSVPNRPNFFDPWAMKSIRWQLGF